MIEIKRIGHSGMDKPGSNIKPENILLVCIDRDRFYDRPSEDLGWFYDIVHQEGEDILLDSYHPDYFDRFEHISFDSDYLEQVDDWLYVNKKNRNDFKVIDGKVIFKDKYVLGLNEDMVPLLEKMSDEEQMIKELTQETELFNGDRDFSFWFKEVYGNAQFEIIKKLAEAEGRPMSSYVGPKTRQKYMDSEHSGSCWSTGDKTNWRE